MENSLQIIYSNYLEHFEWLSYIIQKYNESIINKSDDFEERIKEQDLPELEKERNEYKQRGKNYIFIDYMEPELGSEDSWVNVKQFNKLVQFISHNGNYMDFSIDKINMAEEMIDKVFNNKYKSQIIIESGGGRGYSFDDFIGIVLKEL